MKNELIKLLADEVYHSFNSEGILYSGSQKTQFRMITLLSECDLITGEEKEYWIGCRQYWIDKGYDKN